MNGLGDQVTGPTIELAAKVKAALEADPHNLLVQVPWGNFYVGRIELVYSDGPAVREVVGYLVPDEAEGHTFDFWTAARNEDDV